MSNLPIAIPALHDQAASRTRSVVKSAPSSENIHGRKFTFTIYTVPQIHGNAKVACSERVAAVIVLLPKRSLPRVQLAENLQQPAAQRHLHPQLLREEDGGVLLSTAMPFSPRPTLHLFLHNIRRWFGNTFLGVSSTHTRYTLRLVSGIGPYLQPADVLKWFDPFIRTLFSTAVNEVAKREAREALINDACDTSSDVDTAINRRVDDWIKHYEKHEAPGNVELLQKLKKDIYTLRIPF